MEREFQFKKERNNLASELRTLRNKEKHTAQAILAESKRSEKYQESKRLQTIARGIPQESIKKAAQIIEALDDPEKWDIVDLHDKIPVEVKKFIDEELLHRANGYIWGHGSFEKQLKSFGVEALRGDTREEKVQKDLELIKKIIEFVDVLTEGRFLDPHNFNHVINGQSIPAGKETFDRYSSIIPSQNGQAFWITNKGNEYIQWLGKPLVISSPHNQKVRNFLEKESNLLEVHDGLEHEFFENFMAARELPDLSHNPGLPISLKDSYAKAAREDKGYSWMDIADCLVDLKAEKMWLRKYTDAERTEVEEGIAVYRSGRKKM